MAVYASTAEERMNLQFQAAAMLVTQLVVPTQFGAMSWRNAMIQGCRDFTDIDWRRQIQPVEELFP